MLMTLYVLIHERLLLDLLCARFVGLCLDKYGWNAEQYCRSQNMASVSSLAVGSLHR